MAQVHPSRANLVPQARIPSYRDYEGSGDAPGVVRLRDTVQEAENAADGVPVLRTAITASLIVMKEDGRTCTLVEGGHCLPIWAAAGVAQWIWKSACF
jgi:hypothetical protein